jgi:hypothetical protein
MLSSHVPVKTEAGVAEIAQRRLRLSQRHRTVLLLVDGRRGAAEVLEMAAAAGVAAECFEELEALGLIEPLGDGEGGFIAMEPASHYADSQGPAVQGLLPDLGVGDLAAGGGSDIDRPLEEAREMLLGALRTEAPVAGALTMKRVRKAGSREELAELIDEVEQRISKPRRHLLATYLVRQVRHLLTLPPNS